MRHCLQKNGYFHSLRKVSILKNTVKIYISNSRLAGLGSARPSPDDTADGNELNELQDKY
ncbi:hypothetical protein JYU34_016793 [Plutella xylostella]|uniref:Uncharacterized protein n=1 Tax=Plutella xylostella TaxID=51655 RepID=A0ABQ7Q3T3_PLUXY|nr:hypothetical protein JYU34_016793 [Plutella xylostella]